MSRTKKDDLVITPPISINTTPPPPSLHEVRRSYSQEEGGTPQYVDAMYNFVPGTCFEIGYSLALLDNPGEGGKIVDGYAQQISDIIDRVYTSELGETLILPPNTTKQITLREYFNNKIFKELNPGSDQIGRCLETELKTNWPEGGGRDWLRNQLNMGSTSENYRYENMLTKIRTISAFGTILRELMKENKEVIAQLTGRDSELIEQRNNEIVTKIRHGHFDIPETRARTEKMPLVNERPLGSYNNVTIELTDAGPKNLGFGQIWHRDAMAIQSEGGNEILTKYSELEKEQGRQGMPRQGQDVQDKERPGLLGESSMLRIPSHFEDSGLKTQLDNHKFNHGSGINRWQLHGSYAIESWDQSMPTGGGHSGGTSDIFLALNCLSDESVFGQTNKVKQAGVLVSSFMNFGGYHSFVETYPLVKCIAENTDFNVRVAPEQRGIYREMVLIAKESSNQAYPIIKGHVKAYKATVHDMLQQEEHTLVENPGSRTGEALDDHLEKSSHSKMNKLMPKGTSVKEIVNENTETEILVHSNENDVPIIEPLPENNTQQVNETDEDINKTDSDQTTPNPII